MKNILFIVSVVIVCNMSFSQVRIEDSSMENETIKNEISVFKCHPNPVEDELFVLGTNKIKSIEFLDALGKRVEIYHFNKSIIKMNVSNLKSGIYVIKVIDVKDKVEVKRLVKK